MRSSPSSDTVDVIPPDDLRRTRALRVVLSGWAAPDPSVDQRVNRLREVSAIQLGFPHDFLASSRMQLLMGVSSLAPGQRRNDLGLGSITVQS